MPYAITPRGVGNEPSARRIRSGDALSPGETFVADVESVAGLVLAENQTSLRSETAADRQRRDSERRSAVADGILNGTGDLDKILQILIDELASAKGLPVAAYRAQLRAKLIAP